MLLFTAKRYVRAYAVSCKNRTGKVPDKETLRQALSSFAKALKISRIPL